MYGSLLPVTTTHDRARQSLVLGINIFLVKAKNQKTDGMSEGWDRDPYLVV